MKFDLNAPRCGSGKTRTVITMKYVAVLLLIAVAQVRGESHAQNITIHQKNISVENVLLRIEKQTSYHFIYDSKLEVIRKEMVDVNVDQVTVNEVLDQCLVKLPVTYTIIQQTITIKGDGKKTITAKPLDPPVKLAGTVVDQKGDPVSGVSVRLKGTQTGTVTNAQGAFVLNLPDNKGTLEFSSIGYETFTVAIGGRTAFRINLVSSASKMNEVVVVGYGTQQKRDVTGSVATLNQKTVADLPVSSIDQKMVGQIAGVQVLQQTGAPGGGSSVRLRGNGSIGAGNEPLYVVDGHPYATTNNQSLNPLIFINPNDIESVTVLKDASSTAIYGSRGANGVILIVTKKGRYNQSSVTASAMTGVESVPQKGRPKMMDAQDYMYLQRDKIDIVVRQRENRDATNADYPVAYQNPQAVNGRGTNWYNLLLRNALTQNHSITISKGTGTTIQSLNLEYLNEQGALKYTGLERYSSKLSIESKLGNAVTIAASLQPTFINQKRASTGQGRDDIIGISLWANPTVSPYDASGQLIPFLNSPANKYFTAWGFPNPLFALQQIKQVQQTFRNLGMADIEWKILPGLNFKTGISTNWSYSKYFQFIPSTVGVSNKAPTPGTAASQNSRGTSFDWLNENTLTYDKEIGDHRFNALLGYTAQQNTGNTLSVGAYPFPNDQIQTLNAAQAINSWGESVEKWSLLSYLGRVNYSYKNRYLVTATIRSDGSSRFGEDKRYATFPSVALAWRASEEDFLKNINSLNSLKLRLSYGKIGNYNIGNYAHLANINAGSYVINNTIVSATNIGLSNPSLTWEESTEADAGVDMVLFDNRLTFTAEYYNRKTNDMLLNNVIPAITGFNTQLVNAGNVRNVGVELSLGGTPVAGLFTWNINMNIAFNRNKVLSLNQNNDPIYSGTNDGNPTNITLVGKPIGQFFGYIQQGIFSAADIADLKVPKYPTATVGSVKYKDVNGDGKITDVLDYTAIGNPYPNFTFGINNSFTFKRFDLGVIVNGQQGGKIVNGVRQTVDNLQGFFNVSEEWVNRWRSAAQPGDGIHSGVITNTPSLGHRFSTLWLEDATFLRIANVNLGYSLPEKWMKTNGFMKGARLYVTVQNLATFTRYSGGNPQGQAANIGNVLSPGFDLTSYPLSRIGSFGVNLSF
jgi:TonB-linked SusC/RagA family outer membrane protein